MIWIENDKYKQQRSTIETYDNFVKRNLNWWKANERFERKNRRAYYERFIEYCNLAKIFSLTRNVAEVGPGPFGGILEVCNVPARRKFFVDYIMRELVDLRFIKWPKATYVDAPAEDIPLTDSTVDILVSYNAIDHGWDIWKGISECVRISQRCYLAFDCRGDSEEEVMIRKNMNDLDHYQLVSYEDVKEFVSLNFNKYRVNVSDMGIKPYWAEAVVIVEK